MAAFVDAFAFEIGGLGPFFEEAGIFSAGSEDGGGFFFVDYFVALGEGSKKFFGSENKIFFKKIFFDFKNVPLKKNLMKNSPAKL